MPRLRPILTAVFLMLMAWPAAAQEMHWSEAQRLKGRSLQTIVMGRTSDALYLFRKQNRWFRNINTIEKYDNQLDLEWSKKLDIKGRLVKVALVGNKFLVFESQIDKASGASYLQYQKYNEDLQAEGKPQKISLAVSKNYYDRGDFDVVISADRSKMLIINTERSEEKNFVVHWVLINSSTQEIMNEKRMELPYPYDDFRLIDFLPDNAGNLAFNTVFYDKSRRKDEPLYAKHILFVYNTRADRLADFAVNSETSYIYDIALGADQLNGGFTVGGLFSYTSVNEFRGTFQLTADVNTLEPVIAYFSEFSDDFLGKLIGERAARRKNTGASDFEIRKMIVRSDGGIQLIAEKYYITQQTQTYYFNGIPQTNSRNVYNYDDILVVSLDPAGQYSWAHVINKSQNSVNDVGYYSSFVLATSRDAIHIIFNDRLRSNGDVMQYTLRNNGQVDFNILLKSTSFYVAVIPSESKQVDIHTLIVPSNRDRRFSLLKLVY